MTTTILLAQVLGIVFAVFGLSLLINKKGVLALMHESVHQIGLLWVMGFMVLTVGAIILVLNNTWDSTLGSLITLMGWLSILKGFVLLCFPDWSISLYKKWSNSGMLNISALICFLLGLYFLYWGFM